MGFLFIIYLSLTNRLFDVVAILRNQYVSIVTALIVGLKGTIGVRKPRNELFKLSFENSLAFCKLLLF